jgi:hypothetical protein
MARAGAVDPADIVTATALMDGLTIEGGAWTTLLPLMEEGDMEGDITTGLTNGEDKVGSTEGESVVLAAAEASTAGTEVSGTRVTLVAEGEVVFAGTPGTRVALPAAAVTSCVRLESFLY